MLADLERRAKAIANAADAKAGAGRGAVAEHRVDSAVGKKRARAAVITANARARVQEGINRTLTSSIDAGRR